MTANTTRSIRIDSVMGYAIVKDRKANLVQTRFKRTLRALTVYLRESHQHCILVKYCGYLIGEDRLLQRGLEMGIKSPETREHEIGTILMASRKARLTNTYRHFRQVETPKGKVFWCIARTARKEGPA
ncbi:hypothetical protein AZE42_10473 [Rhizopogon vesiculosus]|uniref:Uncharacterized protein n=1 Tax=Rhizopogon vesiculosus TaxID=180088 RepID=A0A1J8R718_9AGAM|nr:hypothetical protein AZE42_10473 [Rhizopogon vesiculosus]